ncbi:C-8 sterol isomerase [Salpingoeca rosetta]|uniref:C-8 sterol isomerase n=1 Tax=Salpingoeca rosetta (strain ATCC 50818 / BSB-021) TaxID=946362 RepID=F2TWT2_SALR5|nr:C-8 sterol isomerase [Salpingoeca rosetta]EGD72528.1 C-8 sterol isomerase [Salpingoeca rosetta]|eukprot:XP_004999097.1 C-8 sterol isomerase [Salpingoeca rosetta]
MAKAKKNSGDSNNASKGGCCWKKCCCCCPFLKWMFILVGLVVVSGSVYLYHHTDYVFDPETLQRIAKESIEANKATPDDVDRLVDIVVDKLREEYGEHIVEHPEWMFNNAGGAMGAMLVLHCSFSEYIIIFGTPLGTEGHTGRFLADDYFTILHGEQWAFSAGNLTREVYKPGDQHHLSFGEAKQYKMDDTCWALEYAVGNIPSMLPFGFADVFFSTLDFITLYKTVRVSAVNMFSELILRGKI